MKAHVKRILRQFDLDLVRASSRQTIMDFLTDRKIDLVLDVGANEGQFARSLRASHYQGWIRSFEPIASVAQVLATSAAGDPKWDVETFALGATAERAAINVSDSTVFSSLRDTTDAAERFSEQAAVHRTEEIEVRTLDDVVPTMPANTLLKIDTQGFEKQVLDGARRTLPALKGVLMELPIIQLYHGNWKFHEAVEYMDRAGFVPAQIHPVNFHWRDKVSLVEVDCLFRPKNEEVDANLRAH